VCCVLCVHCIIISTLGKELDFTSHDPHAVAGLVKSFLRELPERLVPADLNNYAATVAGKEEGMERNTIILITLE
jgi:RhoGAP domain